MTIAIIIIVLLAYLSLLVELTVFPVPSVASTYQLTYKVQESASGAEYQGALAGVRSWSGYKKILFLMLPAFINVLVFLLPLFFLFFPIVFQQALPLYSGFTSVLVIGLVMVLLGRWVTFASVLKIREQNSQKAADFHLHKKSFFALSRNPSLLGMYIMIGGLFLIFPSLYLGLGILFYLAYMHFKVLLEEDFLTNQFGENYIGYKKTTKRYL